MKSSSKSEVKVTTTLTLNDRETKLLCCLIGAITPTAAEECIRRGLYFSDWLKKLEENEIIEFTGELYDNLYSAIMKPS